MLPSAVLPDNWKGVLRDDWDKTDLFQFIARSLAGRTYEVGKKLLITCDNKVLYSTPGDLSHLQPYSHEEADTRVILHAADCARAGLQKVLIRTTDTDVLVLAIAHCHTM